MLKVGSNKKKIELRMWPKEREEEKKKEFYY
jgi:hypothetical protein